MTLFYQCELRADDGFETVGWIEERGAKVGALVELKTADGNFWTVTAVHDGPLEETVLRAKQAADRKGFPSIVGRSV